MKDERIDLVLEVNGKERARASVTRSYEGVETQRYRWVHTYGLSPKKDWKIFLHVPSSMGKSDRKPFKITKKEFQYAIKKKQNNEQSEHISDYDTE